MAAFLVEETEHLASCVLPLGLLVVHDAVRSGQDDVAELASRQQVDYPLLNVMVADVEARGDDATLVDAPDQINNDFAAAVIIHNLKLANVPCKAGEGIRLETGSGLGGGRVGGG